MPKNLLTLPSLLVAFAVLTSASTADAVLGLGVGVRGGSQVSGLKGAVFGAHIQKSLMPLLSARPTVEVLKKGGVTVINPTLDLFINLNPVGVGPKPYIGGGAGISRVLDVTGTTNKASYNILGGVRLGLVPMLQAFVEVKAVFVQSNRSTRVLAGVNLNL